jgi:hypothetical protein
VVDLLRISCIHGRIHLGMNDLHLSH